MNFFKNGVGALLLAYCAFALIVLGVVLFLPNKSSTVKDSITVEMTVWLQQDKIENQNDFFTRATEAAKQLRAGGMVQGVTIKYFMSARTGKYEAMVVGSMPVKVK